MKIVPVADRILVRRVKTKDKSSGGLHIPQTAKEPSQIGKVLEVGGGFLPEGPIRTVRNLGTSQVETTAYEFAPLICKVGDLVLFGRFAGVEVTINQEPHFLLRQDEIVGIITGVTEEELGDVEAKEPEA